MRMESSRNRFHITTLVLLTLGLVLALAGDAYQFAKSERLQRRLANVEMNTQRQISKISDSTAAMADENQQRFQAIKTQLQDVKESSKHEGSEAKVRASLGASH